MLFVDRLMLSPSLGRRKINRHQYHLDRDVQPTSDQVVNFEQEFGARGHVGYLLGCSSAQQCCQYYSDFAKSGQHAPAHSTLSKSLTLLSSRSFATSMKVREQIRASSSPTAHMTHGMQFCERGRGLRDLLVSWVQHWFRHDVESEPMHEFRVILHAFRAVRE